MLNNVELLLVGGERAEQLLSSVQRVSCFTHKSHCLTGFLCLTLLKDVLKILTILVHTPNALIKEKKPNFLCRNLELPRVTSVSD